MLGSLMLLSSLLGTLDVALGQTFHMGKCPDLPVQEAFDMAKYLGKWYQVEKLPSSFEEGNCIQANFSLKANRKVKVVNLAVRTDGTFNQMEGEAFEAEGHEPAKLHLKFNGILPAAPYWVIATDYENYALVYSCTSFLWMFHVDYAWIMSRTPRMHPETVDHLKTTLQAYGIETGRMRPTDQKNCPSHL